MVYLVRAFQYPAQVISAVKAGAKLHVWEEGLGDLVGDIKGLVVYGPGPGTVPEKRWKMVVDLQGGIIVKAQKIGD